jgi:hypothetical protein
LTASPERLYSEEVGYSCQLPYHYNHK